MERKETREPAKELVEKQRREREHSPKDPNLEPKKGFAKDGNARGTVPKNTDHQPKR